MQPFLGDTAPLDPTFKWILIILGVATIYIAVVRPAMKKKPKDPLSKTPSMNSLAQQRNVERQMQNLLVELSEMTRQITAQLDTRTQKLMMLIQDADERIAELKKRENAQSIAQQNSWPTLSESLVPKNIPDPVDEQHQPIYSLADQGKSASDISRELNRPRGEVELILALRPTEQRA
jgi:hypothetical protein